MSADRSANCGAKVELGAVSISSKKPRRNRMQSNQSRNSPAPLRLIALGCVMLVGILVSVWLSRAYPYGTHPEEGPLLPFIGVTVLLGAGLVLCLRWIPDFSVSRKTLLMIAVIGVAMRGAMFLSYPVLEDDSYRYLWDGAVVAEGVNPYKYAPVDGYADTSIENANEGPVPQDLQTFQKLAEDNSEAHSRVAYPYIKTIYPPIAQLAFGAAHQVDPFGLAGWRLVLLISDLVAFFLLVRTLQMFGRSAAWSVLYWWNPVVIVQGFGAAHMDVLVVPFLLGALMLHKADRPVASVSALAGAAAVKLWPILLFPILTRKWLSAPKRLFVISLAFGGMILLLLLPQVLSALSSDSGVYAYSTSWRRHAFIFAVLEDGLFGWSNFSGQLARLLVLISVSLVTLIAALKLGEDSRAVPVAILISVGALLFLSPTGYPWYLIWLVPFLPFCPNLGLTTLTATAPLYYLRFIFGDENPFYMWGIVPIAFGIPLLILLMSARVSKA